MKKHLATLKMNHKEIVSYAIKKNISLSQAVSRFVPKKEKHNFYRRCKRYVESHKHGKEFFDLFLRKGSHYDLLASCLLACDPKGENVTKEIAENEIPIKEMSSFFKDSEKAYQVFYNRVYRSYPEKLNMPSSEKKKENFYSIQSYEFEV